MIVDNQIGQITLRSDPTQVLQASTKQYVDTQTSLAIAGLSAKATCQVTVISNLNATYNNGTSGIGATLTNAGVQTLFTVTGYICSVNQRILVIGQTDQKQNGIYVLTNAGTILTNWILTRATDYDNSPAGEVAEGNYTLSENLQDFANPISKMYVMTTSGTITIGSSNIVFSEFTLIIAGNGISLSGITCSANIDSASLEFNSGAIRRAALTGDVTASAGSNSTTVASVGGSSASNVHSAELLANAATSSNTISTIVKRDSSGNFSAGTITASLSGNATSITGNITESQVTNLTTDLAAKASTVTTISSGGILSGGGDLSTNRTLTLNRYDIYKQESTESTTSRIFAISDANATISFTNSGGDSTATIPLNATVAIPIGSVITILNSTSSRLLTLSAAGGVTVNPSSMGSLVVGNGGYITIEKIGTDTWQVLALYETYTASITWAYGAWSTSSKSIYLTRNMRNVAMTLYQFDMTGTGSSSSFTSSAAVPSRFLPANTDSGAIYAPSWIYTEPAATYAWCVISVDGATGNLSISQATNTTFSSITRGIMRRQCVTYNCGI